MVATPHKLLGKKNMVKNLKNNQKPFAYLLECYSHALMVENFCKFSSLLPKFLLLKWWKRNEFNKSSKKYLVERKKLKET